MKKTVGLLLLGVVIFVSGVALGRFSLLSKYTMISATGGSIPAGTPLNVIMQTAPDTADMLININTASIETLCALPGIGEATARKIIEYRNQYGLFAQKEELKAVSGIGDGLYSRIEGYITID